MKPPAFAPPYDSPIEEEFARIAVKHLSPDADFIAQHAVDTLCGRFVLDFVVLHEHRRIAFECDGKEFHDTSRDEWRDAMILGDDRVDVIYRLRGTDIRHRLETCLHLVALRDPHIFSEAGRAQLLTLADPALRPYEWAAAPSHDVVEPIGMPVSRQISFSEDGDDDDETEGDVSDVQERKYPPEFLVMYVRDGRPSVHRKRNVFWQDLFAFAKARGGGPLDDVIAAYRRANALPGETSD